MRAFALPTYSEGLIRINLQGRDASGLVAPHAYHRTCDEICELLGELRDARSGGPMVREIVRTRSGPGDDDPSRPPADLIVLWQEDTPTDVVEGPRTGRIGPLPYFRSGGHSSRGFLAAAGPGIAPGSRLAGSSAQDLTATILHLLGEPVPAHVGGRPVPGLPPAPTQQAKR
jgi:predicted AlkP superfamily phosphohydrolase/phosphomutase